MEGSGGGLGGTEVVDGRDDGLGRWRGLGGRCVGFPVLDEGTTPDAVADAGKYNQKRPHLTASHIHDTSAMKPHKTQSFGSANELQ